PAAQATRFLVPFCRSDKKGPAQEGGTKRFNSDNMSPAARAVERRQHQATSRESPRNPKCFGPARDTDVLSSNSIQWNQGAAQSPCTH
ncbi:hypothetical protein PO002_32115, partial [Cupriavidus necator]|uniref:hypothetical protein n=1 Tax=Cupriavidus necator TaxID=106590 RepID=UPI0039C39038